MLQCKLLKIKFVVTLILVFMILFCKLSFAEAQVFYSVKSTGMGESGRASFDSFGSHFLNPAALFLGSEFMLGGAYQILRPDGDNPVSSSAWVFTNNSNSAFSAAGFGYVYKRASFVDHIVTDQDFSISLGFKVLPKLALGALGRRMVRQSSASPGWVKHNMNIGALFMPTSFLNLAFVAYDVMNDDDLEMVPVLSLGSEVHVMGIFKLAIDVLRQEKKNPEKKGSLNSGLEFDLGEGFALRTGAVWDTLNNQTYWTAGLGWLGPRLSAGYAYKNNVNVSKDIAHTLQIWLDF